jgi:hypothetical protein
MMKELKQVSEALKAIDGQIGTVSCNPHDPASVEAAIQGMESMIDQRVQSYLGNETVASLVDAMKERYRQGIIDKAAAARLKADTADE